MVLFKGGHAFRLGRTPELPHANISSRNSSARLKTPRNSRAGGMRRKDPSDNLAKNRARSAVKSTNIGQIELRNAQDARSDLLARCRSLTSWIEKKTWTLGASGYNLPTFLVSKARKPTNSFADRLVPMEDKVKSCLGDRSPPPSHPLDKPPSLKPVLIYSVVSSSALPRFTNLPAPGLRCKSHLHKASESLAI